MNRRLKLLISLVLVIAGILVATRYALQYLAPFLLALIFAAIIDPFVNMLEKRLPISRGFSVLLVLLLFVVALALIVFLLVTNLTAEVTHFLSLLPRYSTFWEEWLRNLFSRVENLLLVIFAEIPAPIAEAVQPELDQVTDTLRMVGGWVLSSLSGLPNFGLTVVIASIATFFMSRDKRLFGEFFMSLVPKSWRPKAQHVKDQVANGIFGFLRSQLTLISLSGSLAVIGLTALRIRYAWLLGLLVALFDFLPMIGPSAIFVPMIVYYLFMGNIAYAVWLTVILGVILVSRQLAEPRIVGAQLGLHPLTSLTAVYLGIRLLGVSGFILGPLIMVVLKAIMVVIFIPAWKQEG
ncbi:MAG: sporulation integral membrane protein YtvI [Firmicutes bacterium]|nr:sporulation integral membrane protein YtvI [Bacillota bacterium]